ncbi:hypothetical protein BXZ70DRAFT_567025 [Cristinia sonorae]|uniref:Mixed lineage kinase domain-containing protein n=1 Tax=Cristinia sonorae TaxID=1940300 RepID=A0A8K0XKU3_9AGAR|nr:hypothetical protein BXZ70DRAFT_567025 [Cristinia sonorae]
MPLRYVRRKLTASTVLTVAVATTAITRELADMAQFPPAKAAASLLLMIFQTIQSVELNRNECYRLARRCLSLLVDMRDQMEGRWEDAPESLLRNFGKFEETLHEIHAFMTKEANKKWKTRLMRTSTIEEALIDFNSKLDDAARAFQIATLINIQLALSGREQGREALRIDVGGSSNSVFATPDGDLIDLTSSPTMISSPGSLSMSFEDIRTLVDGNETDSMSQRTLSDEFVLVSESVQSEIASSISKAVPAAPELELLDHRGFRRYSQADVHLKGRVRSKTGWWSNSSRGKVGGQSVIVKMYDGSAGTVMKKWIHDVKILQNVYHPNLPQMVGYSNDEAPTPFILLANVEMKLPQALILDMVENASLASCAVRLLKLYRDTLDATLYVQRQLNLSDDKTQDYVENTSYVIDDEGKVIMGLPSPEIANWVSWRNYGLTYSIRDIYMRILPNGGRADRPYEKDDEQSVELQQKISHLGLLARALLPDEGNAAEVSAQLSEMIDGDEDDEDNDFTSHTISLRQIRLSALSMKNHETMWRNGSIPAFKFSVGDLGYIPEGKDFDSFCKLQNVMTDGLASFELAHSVLGWQGCWEGPYRKRQDLQAFPAPFDVWGWAVVVPSGSEQDVQVIHDTRLDHPTDGWKFLLEHGRSIGARHGVRPEELILITRTGTDQQFKIRDFRTIPFMHHRHSPHSMHNPSFPGHHPFGGMHNNRGGFAHGFGQSQFGGHHHMSHTHLNPVMAQQMQPIVTYLFTSHNEDHIPYWSDSPVHIPLPKGVERPELKAKCSASVGWNHGFVNYVQLHKEDFIVPPKRRLMRY